MALFGTAPEWVRIVTASGEGLLAIDAVALVKVVNQQSIKFTSTIGDEYEWRTDGTLAEYGALMKALGLSNQV